MWTIARNVERIMIAFDDLWYVQKDAGIDTTLTEKIVRRCEQLTYKYQHVTKDCPFCTGIVGSHDTTCPLMGDD